ncbi:MAG: sugar transferase [Clostridiaceae bacterium]|nr:sugar transferase [Clostridiaceae bacterium]
MVLKKWDKLPQELKNKEIKPYYLALVNKNVSLIIKRVLDIVFSLLLIILLCPIFIIIMLIIFIDSPGNPFFAQIRITQYNKEFKIIKFRTMIKNADKLGTEVTVDQDPRITQIGRFLRKVRLDEIPQLFNILLGQMTFVGTRPEVPGYVACYTNEMMATLLLPAGVTSLASIKYKDEDKLLNQAEDPDNIYIEKVLPDKMQYNLSYLKNISLKEDIKIIFATVLAILNYA